MPFAAALSTAEPTARALDEVCSAVHGQLPGDPDLALVFFTPPHADAAPALARVLHERLRPKCLFGGIGEAVVGTGQEIEHRPGLSLWLGKWTGKIEMEACHLTPQQTSDGLSLLGWPDALVEGGPDPGTLLLLGDPFTFPAQEIFLPQVNADYPGLRVHGGMASGMAGPGQTPLIFGPEVVDVGAVGVLLRGAGVRGVVSQGCRPIGEPLVITKGHDNVILELGGQPPMDRLKAMYDELPAHDQDLFQRGPHVGLAMTEYRDRFGRGDFLVRNLYSVDRANGAITITDRVRVGQTVQFHVRDAASVDEDLRLLLRQELAHAAAKPEAALVFTCNGRGTRLFGEPHHDAAALREEIGPVPAAGLFAAGELGPVGGRNFIHGFTASVVLFDDAATPPAAAAGP
jgi:small ligand-binding sensory domain FIST